MFLPSFVWTRPPVICRWQSRGRSHILSLSVKKAKLIYDRILRKTPYHWYVCMYACTHTYICIHAYTYIHTCIMHMPAYIHVHTHAHTYKTRKSAKIQFHYLHFHQHLHPITSPQTFNNKFRWNNQNRFGEKCKNVSSDPENGCHFIRSRSFEVKFADKVPLSPSNVPTKFCSNNHNRF